MQNTALGRKEASLTSPESTGEFVKKLHDNQKKAEKNRNRAEGNEGNKLPGKQHSTNK
ncbi:DUF4023 family protein [Cohnella sp. AR92]|uniref:DUF4023 family protein n=1 Tax=Cohnella sp. AR92 TaxID=648716 RepID=UPI000F8E777E|nr:DUF4023 family protein [Cohnella sp. AR92]RUS45153.1 DUF4023 domain-containing protein [Cohnella sp. AR92]